MRKPELAALLLFWFHGSLLQWRKVAISFLVRPLNDVGNMWTTCGQCPREDSSLLKENWPHCVGIDTKCGKHFHLVLHNNTFPLLEVQENKNEAASHSLSRYQRAGVFHPRFFIFYLLNPFIFLLRTASSLPPRNGKIEINRTV